MRKKSPTTIDFTNDLRRVRRGRGFYGFVWRQDSRTLARLHGCRELFQAILSQAGAYLLTGGFHDFWNFTVGKAEGGFIIPGRGEFIPTSDCMAMDPPSRRRFHATADMDCEKLAALLTCIVRKWDPARHEDSMYEVAAKHVGTTPEALRAAVEGNSSYRMRIYCLSRGTAFGEPISYFFGWNSGVPYDAEYRDYWLSSSSNIRRIIEMVGKGLEPSDAN